MKPQYIQLHIFRVIGAFVALYFGFLTVSHLPFADATALGFTQVLLVAFLSRFFLSETTGVTRLMTILLGFVGVMLVVQPSFEAASFFYILIGLGGALGAAIAVICVRKMAQTESKTVLLAYQAIFVGFIAFIPSLLSWQWPNMQELLLLIFVGVISSVAQWIGVTAYKWGEANVIANVEYAKIIYSLVLGYWLFSETPNALAMIGAGVILTSAAIPALINHNKKQA